MKESYTETAYTDRRAALWLFVLCFAVYAFLSPGNLGLDSLMRYDLTRHVVALEGPVSTEGDIPFDWNGPARTIRYPLGQSFLFLPFDLVFGATSRALLPETLGERAGELLVSLTFFPFYGALGITLLFALLREFGESTRTALRFALLCGIATPLLWYGRTPHEVTQVLTFHLGGILLGLVGLRRESSVCLYGAVALLWLPVLMRSVMLIEAGLLTVWLLSLAWRHEPACRTRHVKHLLLAAVGAALMVIGLTLADNLWRFGHPTRTGYHIFFERHGVDPFSNPFGKGFLGLTLGLDYGIIWHCPLLLAAVIVGIGFRGRFQPAARRLYVFGLVLFAILLLLYSRYVAFAGSIAFGPRLHVHLLPFLLLPLAGLLHHGFPRWLLAVAAMSFGIQIAGVVLAPNLESVQDESRLEGVIFQEMGTMSPPGILPRRFINIGHKLDGTLTGRLRESLGREPTRYEESTTEWDFFWVRARAFGPAIRWSCAALALTFAVLAAISARQLLRIGRSAGELHRVY